MLGGVGYMKMDENCAHKEQNKPQKFIAVI
jgi:hypothetical protein